MFKKNQKYIIFGIIVLIVLYISWKVGFIDRQAEFIESLKQKYNPIK